MDLSAISALGGLNTLNGIGTVDTAEFTGILTGSTEKTEGTLMKTS